MRTATIRNRARRHLFSVLALAAASSLALAVPAAAQPHGDSNPQIAPGGSGGDPGDPGDGDEPLPGVLIDANPRCEPAAGVDHQTTIVNGLNRPHVLTVEWTNIDTGDGGNAGPAGGSDTGEGDVHLTATLHYPPIPAKGVLPVQVLPPVTVDNEVLVTVSCPDPDDDPDDDPVDPEDPEDPETDVKDEIVEATPTFTG